MLGNAQKISRLKVAMEPPKSFKETKPFSIRDQFDIVALPPFPSIFSFSLSLFILPFLIHVTISLSFTSSFGSASRP